MIKIKKQKVKMIGVKTKLIILGLLITITMSSCKKIEEEDRTIFLQDEKKDIFDYTYVQLGDVVLSHEIPCQYIQSVSKNYKFAIKNLIIKNVYVTTGDIVKKGQLLAELENDNVEVKISDSNYIIEKNSLLMRQAKETKQLDLQEAKDIYNTSKKSNSDQAVYKETVNKVQVFYQQSVEGYQNSIEIEKLKLQSYQKQEKESKIYAGISGIISFVKPSIVGTYSNPEEDIITIVDDENCVYETNDITYKDYFMKKKNVDLYVKDGDKTKKYSVKPTSLSLWKNKMVFILDQEGFTPKMGDYGYLYAILGKKESVLYVESKAVHKAKDKYYVYVLDEQGNRQMKYITIGLQGNETTEIVSGIKEGEKIILKMESFWGE